MDTLTSFINAHAKLILDTGKIVLALIMFGFSLLSILIVINFAMLQRKLQAMELSANQTTQEVSALFTQARAGLQGLRASLAGVAAGTVNTTSFNKRELLQHGGQLAMLLLNRERSVIAWGMLGFKMAGNAARYFFRRR